MEKHINAEELTARISVGRTHRKTPLMFEYEMIQRAKSVRKHIVLPEGFDERILRAAEILLLREVVDITLLGSEEKIQQRISQLGLNLQGSRPLTPALHPGVKPLPTPTSNCVSTRGSPSRWLTMPWPMSVTSAP